MGNKLYEANKSRLLSSSGQRLTSQLFEELARDDVAAKPIFKLSEWRKKYVEVADLTGYKACEVLLGDWEHWLMLTRAPGFAAALAEWNAEVEQKLRSEALESLRKQAKTAQGTAAAKYLATIGKVDKRKKGEEQVEEKRSISEDAKRIGLTRVK